MYWKFDPFKGALYLTGDVDGPASATNNAIPRYSGTSGKTVKASGIIIDDSNNMSGIGAVTITGVFDTTAAGTLNIGTGNASIINIGTGAATQNINIGGAGDTVYIAGTLAWVDVTNLEVTDKVITVNNGGAAASGDASGIEIEENNVATGFVKSANSRQSWDHKAPASLGVFRLTPPALAFTMEVLSAASANRTWTLPDVSDTFVGVGATQTLTGKTLTSPAINGGAINSATVGLTTPAAGYFTTLSVTGAATLASVINIPSTAFFKGNATFGYRFNNAADTITALTIADPGNVTLGQATSGTADAHLFQGAGTTKKGVISRTVNTVGSTNGSYHQIELYGSKGLAIGFDNGSTTAKFRLGSLYGTDNTLEVATVTDGAAWVLGAPTGLGSTSSHIFYGRTISGAQPVTYQGGIQFRAYAIQIGCNGGDGPPALTDGTTKAGFILCPHWDNDALPFPYMSGVSNNTVNEIIIGGGASVFNSSTSIRFYTGATVATTVGIDRGGIDNAGNWTWGASSGTYTDYHTAYKSIVGGNQNASTMNIGAAETTAMGANFYRASATNRAINSTTGWTVAQVNRTSVSISTAFEVIADYTTVTTAGATLTGGTTILSGTAAGSWILGSTSAIGTSTYAGNSIVGRTNGTVVAVGYVGQVMQSVVTNALLTVATANVTSLTLTPGRWMVTGAVIARSSPATRAIVGGSIVTTSGANGVNGTTLIYAPCVSDGASTSYGQARPVAQFFNITADTIIYLTGNTSTASGGTTDCGELTAVRIA